MVLHYKTHSERTFFTVSNLGKQSMILRYTWLKDHNLEINWQTREVQMNQCPSQCEGCYVIQKKQVSWKKMETRALNVCWSRPLPEYAKDLEENKTPFWMCKVEYKQGDRLFVTRILPEPTMEDLHVTSITSQKLTEGAHQALEAQREPFTLPNCVRKFKSIFAKEDFNILLEHR